MGDEATPVGALAAVDAVDPSPAYLVMEVVTYTDLSQRADLVSTLIERILSALFPTFLKWRVTHWSPRPGASRETSHVNTAPGAVGLRKIRALLRDGEVGTLLLVASIKEPAGYLTSAIALQVHLGNAYRQNQGHHNTELLAGDPREARFFSLVADTRVWREGISVGLQNRLVSVAVDLFTELEGACGFINIRRERSSPESLTEYEEHVGWAYGPNRQRLWREVRGPFWANLLSDHHVARLGGNETLGRAPCAVVAPVDAIAGRETGRGAAYLQLTQHLAAAIPASSYRQLEAFLAPILTSSHGQRGYAFLTQEFAQHAGGISGVRNAVAGDAVRVSELPTTDVLLEYDHPEGWPAFSRALDRVGVRADTIYRSIPLLQSLFERADAIGSSVPERVSRRPRTGPILPAIYVHPYILSFELTLELRMAEVPSKAIVAELARLLEKWQNLTYTTEAGPQRISYCATPQLAGEVIIWQVALAPVGQDAYFQLVLMLDEFSRTKSRLLQLDILPRAGLS